MICQIHVVLKQMKRSTSAHVFQYCSICNRHRRFPELGTLTLIIWFKHILFHLHEKGLGRAQMLC